MSDTLENYNLIASEYIVSRMELAPYIRFVASKISDGDAVFDIGCGGARLYRALKLGNISAHYTGIDPSEKMIEYCLKEFNTDITAGTAKFLVGDFFDFSSKIDITHARSTIITAIASFHHIPSDAFRQEALLNMRNVLKDGGTLLMLNWNLRCRYFMERYNINPDNPTHEYDVGDVYIPWKTAEGKIMAQRYYHSFTPEELNALALNTGFKIKEQYYLLKVQRSDKENGENIFSWWQV